MSLRRYYHCNDAWWLADPEGDPADVILEVKDVVLVSDLQKTMLPLLRNAAGVFKLHGHSTRDIDAAIADLGRES